jgi:hypothetical protein
VSTTTKRRRSRRWLRAVLPPAVVLILIVFTITVHVLQQADPTDKSFLSPTSTAGDGAGQLADLLAAHGITVDRQTTTPNAIAAVGSGAAATVLVTTPGLVYGDYLHELRSLPSGTRVVLVAPDARALSYAGLGAKLAGPRWTAAAPAAGCSADFAAGPAAVLRWRYTWAYDEQARCYDGGVVEMTADDTTITLVGAADAFRNDRSGEHANQAFAVGLLSRSPRVVWLDLHEHEQPPPVINGRGPHTRTAQPVPPGSGPGSGSGDQGGNGDGGQNQNGGSGNDQGDGGGGNPTAGSALGRAFPPAVWATILLLALAAIALAAASARRLGAPVPEPLPVRVRAAETVYGLGGLYRRARARDTSLATLQGAAVRRLADHFDLPPDSTTADVAERAAAYTGLPIEEVRAVLGAAAEDTDRDLAAAATAVQNLVRAVTQQPVTNEGNVL